MLTGLYQWLPVSTSERIFLEDSRSFSDRKHFTKFFENIDSIFMVQCPVPYNFSNREKTCPTTGFVIPFDKDNLICKVGIWDVTCAQAKAFIFDRRMNVHGKESKFLNRMCHTFLSTLTRNLYNHTERMVFTNMIISLFHFLFLRDSGWLSDG